MGLVLLTTGLYCVAVWLVFFKFKWVRFNMAWGLVSAYVGIHLWLALVIGLRFVTPAASSATIVQHTIQLIPRLPEPTLVTAVLAAQDEPVKKGQPLFQFDRRPYEYKVRQLEAEISAGGYKIAAKRSQVAAGQARIGQLQAELVAAQQDARIMQADLEAADSRTLKVKSELEYARLQDQRYRGLAQQNAGPAEDAEKWRTQVLAQEAGLKEALAEASRARLKYDSKIGGVNTTVAGAEGRLKEGEASLEDAQATLREAEASLTGLEAELKTAQYYLDNTTMVAPEDGRIVNLQVKPGMVAGVYRVGGIAAFICDDNRYLLATYFQESLKFVKAGQPVEFAMALYPGQVFRARVKSIWQANGGGQYLPTDVIPKFRPGDPEAPQGQFAVQIALDERGAARFPIGGQGIAVIYTSDGGGFVFLRRIAIRMNAWFYWLCPLPF
ncbi:MAG: HlyD family secretion protein [Acidobacteria bacterium]|nr:HlyD family secretion protein [Acidobacteriota bacterium]